MAGPLETHLSQRTWVSLPNLIDYSQTVQASRAEIRRKKKFGLLASRLSRSLEVVESDTDRSGTYDFLLLINNLTSYNIISDITDDFGRNKELLRTLRKFRNATLAEKF